MNPTRREMLRVGLSGIGGLGAVTLGGTMPAFVSKFALAGHPTPGTSISNDNVLVIVQLSGGNDGLNTVIPVGDDAYFDARPTIGLGDRVHPIGNGLALNPGMTAFKELFDDGRLAIVNGCGYPNPNRSHFKSLEIWHTANPMHAVEPATAATASTAATSTGWLGHYIDHVRRGTENLFHAALNIGPELPQALVASEQVVPSIQSLDDAASMSPAMQYLARQATNAALDPVDVNRAAERYTPDAIYPGGVGQQLRLIAQLICANAGTKIFYCQVAGFDTHANQLGQHERLLTNVSSAIAAFTRDMEVKGFGEKVAVMCFSEFGRRVEQNSSGGTDHGAAGPMFVVGGKIKGGVYGAHPSLSDLDDGDLKYTTDFRRVYATLLDRWLNTSSGAVLKNTFEPLAFL